MNQAILDQAHRIFTFSQKADLASDFESVYNRQYLENLEDEMKKAKTKALKPRFGITFDESLWDEEGENQKELVWQLIQYALGNDKGYMMDWKGSAEDVIFNIKRILPAVQIKYLGEEQVKGDWFEKIQVNNDTFVLPLDEDELMINQVINKINPYLIDTHNKIILTTDIGSDDHYYLLVNKDSEEDFEELKFYRP